MVILAAMFFHEGNYCPLEVEASWREPNRRALPVHSLLQSLKGDKSHEMFRVGQGRIPVCALCML